jgi:hypothetical protein
MSEDLFLCIQMSRELVQVWKWQRNKAALDRDKESAGKCTECCGGTVKNGKNTCDSASDETGVVGPAIVLPSDSAANLTAQDSPIRSGLATPVTRDEHNSRSPHDTVGSVTLPSFMPNGARYSAEKLNLTSSLQSPDSNQTLACKTLYAPCLNVVLVIVILILSCILCAILISEDFNTDALTFCSLQTNSYTLSQNF